MDAQDSRSPGYSADYDLDLQALEARLLVIAREWWANHPYNRSIGHWEQETPFILCAKYAIEQAVKEAEVAKPK